MENYGKLFSCTDWRTGRPITYLLGWERSWKNVKVPKYPTRFANELRLGVRDNPKVEQVLQANVILPEVGTSREYWRPNVNHEFELAAIEDVELRAMSANLIFLERRSANLEENARRNALNKI